MGTCSTITKPHVILSSSLSYPADNIRNHFATLEGSGYHNPGPPHYLVSLLEIKIQKNVVSTLVEGVVLILAITLQLSQFTPISVIIGTCPNLHGFLIINHGVITNLWSRVRAKPNFACHHLQVEAI